MEIKVKLLEEKLNLLEENENLMASVPGKAPAALMMPKTDPECLGAISVGLTTTAVL